MLRFPPHLGVTNRADPALDMECMFITEAARIQLVDHVHPLWETHFDKPGVGFYSSFNKPPKQAAVMTFVRDGFNDEAAAYHTAVGSLVSLVVDVSRSRILSVSATHESNEAAVNPFLMHWVPDPLKPGRKLALEIADPVQRNYYEIPVTIGGVTRAIKVSDFVTPAWFGIGPDTGVYDYMARCRAKREILPGGYLPASEDGEIITLTSKSGGAIGAEAFQPLSRLRKIVELGAPQ